MGNVPDTRESPVKEMVKELKEFGVKIYGYNPLLSREEIEAFGVKALDFSFSTGFLFSKKKKCVDVRGMFDGEEAKKKGFYYRSL
jgi:UDPglucose 6-dehydrogenase/UDP-N-acetyl-D-galactosamine dehydrogenase